VPSSSELQTVGEDLQGHKANTEDPHATLPIETINLSDEAVTAAKLAAASVESGAIATDSVGQDEVSPSSIGREELLEALGTSKFAPITGTTHFEGVILGTLDRGSGDLITVDNTWSLASCTPISQPSDTTSTSFENIASLTGALSIDSAPNGATLFGRFRTRAGISGGDSGDAIEVRPELHLPGTDRVILDELTVATTNSLNNDLDSGWTEITSTFSENYYVGEKISARVDGGTGEFGNINFHAVVFEWRID
jgi:hypothetical protein